MTSTEVHFQFYWSKHWGRWLHCWRRGHEKKSKTWLLLLLFIADSKRWLTLVILRRGSNWDYVTAKQEARLYLGMLVQPCKQVSQTENLRCARGENWSSVSQWHTIHSTTGLSQKTHPLPWTSRYYIVSVYKITVISPCTQATPFYGWMYTNRSHPPTLRHTGVFFLPCIITWSRSIHVWACLCSTVQSPSLQNL